MYKIIKRVFDIIIAIIGMIISFPISIVIAIVIKATSKGKVIFKQKRLGKNGKIIKIYKFRTMVDGAEEKLKQLSLEEKEEYENNYHIRNDSRVTKVGKFLRKTNLDELPQFFNILKGDLSFIGPRPILSEEIKKYGNRKEKLLSVKPGLTGYWQINRNKCKNYEDRIKLELYYVDNASFLFDLKIFFKTIFYCAKNLIKA